MRTPNARPRTLLSFVLTFALVVSSCAIWLLHPLSARATYSCGTCYNQVGWTGARGTVAGELATIQIPQNISVGSGSIYDAVWVWDDTTAEYVAAGVVAYSGTNNLSYYVATKGSFGYQEYIQQTVPNGNRGYNTDFFVYKHPNFSNQHIYGIHSSAGDVSVSGPVFGNGWMTRAMIGTITGGTNLSFSYTAWTYNKYILYPSYNVYYQLGSHTSSILNNPPYGQWNPAPQNDPYQTGGRRELPGN